MAYNQLANTQGSILKNKEDEQNAPKVKSFGEQSSGSASAGVQTAPSVSGGFTNLSKYMGQNKQAGQQLTSRLGTGINRDVGTSVGQTNKALSSTEKAQQTAQSNVATGQDYLKQMAGGITYKPDQSAAPEYLNPYLTKNSPASTTTPTTPTAANAAAAVPATPAAPGTFDAEKFANDPAAIALSAGRATMLDPCPASPQTTPA